MKKKILVILLITFQILQSQSITVSTSSYTVPQMVNNILINSPCINASNITWRTGNNFGSSNGIGYFQNTNPSFPMSSGVILSTGNVLNAVGPNTTILSDGLPSWTGDTNLESTLASYGISMNSTNATFLEFDFTPISSNFDFDFLFASEDYGSLQCQFSDAFAFLLTNTNTGITTNLAIVPGTNLPISVVTIRDFLYNSSCPSSKPQYFGSFNGGSNAVASATNFNGQTKKMNVTSTLIPNTPYKLKIVIADRENYQSDSAIFLAANSFNIGQNVLGKDLTIANNNAICYGNPYILSTGLNPSQYSFIWKKDGIILAGQNGPSITITQGGNYELIYTNIISSCQPIIDNITIEYYPEISANGTSYTIINTNTNGTETFNLDSKIPEILGVQNPQDFTVNFYLSLINANNGINPISNSSNYNNTSNPQTLYARVMNNSTGCFRIRALNLIVSSILSLSEVPLDTLSIYPNPVSNMLTINSKDTLKKVSLYNILGQELITNFINTLNFNLDMSSIMTGNYFLKIDSENYSKILKIRKN